METNVRVSDLFALDPNEIRKIKKWYSKYGREVLRERIQEAIRYEIQEASKGHFFSFVGIPATNMCIDLTWVDKGNVDVKNTPGMSYVPHAIDCLREMLRVFELNFRKELDYMLYGLPRDIAKCFIQAEDFYTQWELFLMNHSSIRV